jgi:hypothetical protein
MIASRGSAGRCVLARLRYEVSQLRNPCILDTAGFAHVYRVP